MASLAEPGPVGVKELIRKLEIVRDFLMEEAAPPVRAAFCEAESNHGQCGALVLVHQVRLAKICVLVQIVLGTLADPWFSQLDGEVKGLSLLLLSVDEIKRCVQSGRCCLWSSSELPNLDYGNGSFVRRKFSRLREFFFSVDLARVAFVIIMLESKIHEGNSWRRRRQSRCDIEEEFCNRPAHELFEWSERRRRPVLKQSVWDLGRDITQHIVLNRPAEFAQKGLFNPWNIWTADLGTEWEEPGAEPRNSLPLEIDFEDVHDQVYLRSGNFGAVVRCSWNGKLAAMKIIQLDPEEPELERRFEMEVSILASLQHPNAVPVFGFGYMEGRAKGFFVMEHMQTDLSNLIRERRERSGEWRMFPLDVAVDIMSQIAEGMCALRLRRVIHRDLKPANILVNRRDESMGPSEGFYDVKLADFGCANVRDDLGSVFCTLRMGTPACMAPEVMSGTSLPERNGEHGYSWKADVYSFAMVCAEILSGERPFRHLSGMAQILAAVSGGERPELPLDGGDPLRRLIEDCWKLNAEERPNFEEVRRRLWECRVYHFFTAEETPTSWQTFGTRLAARRRLSGISRVRAWIYSWIVAISKCSACTGSFGSSGNSVPLMNVSSFSSSGKQMEREQAAMGLMYSRSLSLVPRLTYKARYKVGAPISNSVSITIGSEISENL